MKHLIKMRATDHDNKCDIRNAANTRPEWSAVKRKIYSNCKRITLPGDHINVHSVPCGLLLSEL